MTERFVSWHNHTSYSVLDGASRISDLTDRAAELGMSHLAISDHGNLYGLIEFYKECKAKGIQPILGSEFYHADDRTLREKVSQKDENGVIDGSDKRYYHLSIYARNNTGYNNLIKLSSDAFINGMFYKPRTDNDILAQHSDGLIIGTGCLGGEVLQKLMHHDFDGALAAAARLQEIAGKENMFVEIMNHGLPEQAATNPHLIEIARKLDAPLVATMDSHYVHKEDALAHDALLCQPPGTLVEVVEDGSFETKKIEDIVAGDTVRSWISTNRRGRLRNTGSLVTRTASRDFDGDLVVATTDRGVSKYTPDHICVARFDADLTAGNYVVYLMRSGDKFRIGTTQWRKTYSNHTLGPIVRTKEENADSVWILGVYPTDHDARRNEAYKSWKYNIPTWTFGDPKKAAHAPRTPYYVDLWDMVGPLTDQAINCLNDHGKDIRFPLWSRFVTGINQRTPNFVQACNLESGMLVCEPDAMPVPQAMTNNGSGAWQPAEITREPYIGPVYSMNVDTDHTYIADGIVTHNCCQTHTKLADEKRFRFSNNEYYLKSPEEMRYIFSELPEACDNTFMMAEKVDVTIDFDTLHLPYYAPPEGYESPIQYLTALAQKGLQKRYENVSDEARERLAYELSVIETLGLASYFLIVWDVIKFADRNGIRRGAARGSAAGSLVSYCMNITKVDPLRHGLLFERFLNPSRVALPDIDLDFDTRYRDMLIKYTIDKYGSDRVAQIITFSRILARGAVRDASRVLGLPPSSGGNVAKLMPGLIMGESTPLTACLEFNPRFEAGYNNAEELRQMYASDPQVKEIVDVAKGLEGLVRQDSVHAAAVVITPDSLTNYIPIQKNKDGTIVTQYEKNTIEDLGLLKMDYLGLRNLNVITDTIENIGFDPGIESTTFDDFNTFQLLREGKTIGVFQLESSPMRNLLQRLQPNSIDDIAAVVALYRPGPMGSNMHNDYADRKNGRQPITLFHEDAEDLLGDTFSLMIYQEQVMKIAQRFAGYSLVEADSLRKIVGKKLRDKMIAEKDRFVQGCRDNGYSAQLAERLFEMIEHHASYSFNKCLTGDTVVVRPTGNRYTSPEITLEDLYHKLHNEGNTPWRQKFYNPNKGVTILAQDKDGRIRPKRIKDVVCNGINPVWTITTSDGRSITATANHRHMTTNGWRRVDEIAVGDKMVMHGGFEPQRFADFRTTKGERSCKGVVNGAYGPDNHGYVDGGFMALKEWTATAERVCQRCQNPKGRRIERAHLDGDRTNNSPSNLEMLCVSCHKKHDYRKNGRKKQWDVGHSTYVSEVVSIEYAGEQLTYDLEMEFDGHNFVANGFVTHNSHAYGYAYTTYQTAFLKANYPKEYMAALCSSVSDKIEKASVFMNESRAIGLEVLTPDVNDSNVDFAPTDKGIRTGLAAVKSIGPDFAEKIVDARQKDGPYDSLIDFVQRIRPKVNQAEALALSGAFDIFGTRLGVHSVAGDVIVQNRKVSKKIGEGQESLFDSNQMWQVDIPKSEYPPRTLLENERASIGIYVSGHPLDEYVDKGTGVTINDVEESLPVGEQVKVLVHLTEVEHKVTKAGAKMANLIISDQTGYIEAVCFPYSYGRASYVEGAIGIIGIKIGTDYAGERNYIIQNFSALDEEKDDDEMLDHYVSFYLPHGFAQDAGAVSKLKGILLSHYGNTGVNLHVSPKTRLQLPDDIGVEQSDELIEEVKNLFSEFSSR